MARLVSRAYLFAVLLSIIAVVTAAVGPQTIASAAKIQNPKAQPPIHLYVVASGVRSGLPCSRPRLREMVSIAESVKSLLASQFPSLTPVRLHTYEDIINPTFPPNDVLQPYLGNPPAYVAIATICKTADVINVSIAGYDVEKNNDGTSPPIVQSGLISGTFDQLESGGAATWVGLFGTVSPPPWAAIPNVAFLPIGNDPNGVVNPRLLHNLPITAIATPAPYGPTAPPAPGGPPPAATPPPDRLSECEASTYHILITGRVVLTSASNDISRAIVAGGSLKWSQPEWNPYYTSAGLLMGLLYNPNSAEIGVDVFVCPPAKAPNHAFDPTAFIGQSVDAEGNIQRVSAVPDVIYQVGGLNHHITGHHTTPAIGTDPLAAQRAEDLAVVDLENQLECIIYKETKRMGIPTVFDTTPTPITQGSWCGGNQSKSDYSGYWNQLEGQTTSDPNGTTDTAVLAPINAAIKLNLESK